MRRCCFGVALNVCYLCEPEVPTVCLAFPSECLQQVFVGLTAIDALHDRVLSICTHHALLK